MTPRRILFVVSEMAPWIKTGGLGDVAGALPVALSRLGCEVKVLMPAYADALKRLGHTQPVEPFIPPAGLSQTRLLTPQEAPDGPELWLLDAPGFSDRSGNPYVNEFNQEWPDNAMRFQRLALVGAAITAGQAGLTWRPEVVHCHDWQTGLLPLHAMLHRVPIPSIFTIHNLEYRGLFAPDVLGQLGLPSWLYHPDALEFYGHVSFIKGGLLFADRLTTVSPTYADEICTPEGGCGLDGLLRLRRDRLHGILNGIDHRVWDPAHDAHLPATYNVHDLLGKATCKRVLQESMGLTVDPGVPLIGVVSRLIPQKGIDLILQALPRLLELPAQLVVLGQGDPALEQGLREAAALWPQRLAVQLTFSEMLAHRIEAGSDMFLMPSRFEPCGLNQLYSLRYGTIPIVRRSGGLADTVVDANAATLQTGSATGIVFDMPTADALAEAVQRAVQLYHDYHLWGELMWRAMSQDFSWERSAHDYLAVYEQAILDRAQEWNNPS